MIAFNRSEDPEDEIVQKLQKILNEIYGEDIFAEKDDPIDDFMSDQSMHHEVSLVEINDIIYNALFNSGGESIDITIFKNPNNSMSALVNGVDYGN
jgi:hypothetical protein